MNRILPLTLKIGTSTVTFWNSPPFSAPSTSSNSSFTLLRLAKLSSRMTVRRLFRMFCLEVLLQPVEDHVVYDG